MAESERLYFRADGELRDEVVWFQKKHGFEDQSKATRRLVEIGVRESKGPILSRMKTRGADAAFYLTIAAFLTVALGYSTDIIGVVSAIRSATVFIAIAVVLLAVVELFRALNGHSEVGEVVRGVRQ